MKHIDSIYWAVLFTDIKNYTLKTSLLTKLQILDFLSKQEEIIKPITTKYFWKIIKSIWDSYMIIFEKPENSVKAAIEIQNEIKKYNKEVKFNLKKIELRISIDYWIVERELNNNRLDIFWNTVNISSRIQSITKENSIYVTKNVIDKIKNDEKINYIKLWKNTFKWILYEIDIFEVTTEKYKENNKKNIINNTKYLKIDTDLILNKEINKIIFNFSIVWWLIWLQKIPIFDNYVLIFLHLYMLREISKKHWIKLTSEEHKEILYTTIWSFFVVYLSIIIFSNINNYLNDWLLLIISVITNIIITYIIWKIIELYFYKKSKTVKAKNKELKYLFKQ